MERIRRARPFVAAILVAVGISGWLSLLDRPAGEPAPLALQTPVPSPTAAPTATAGPIVVFVSGAVRAPGVYTLAAESRVVDLLLAAGGPTEVAAVESLNQATRLSDGMQVHMPEKGSTAKPAPLSPPETPFVDRSKRNPPLVRLNSADRAMLETLPGIGPVLAARILDYRGANGPFASIEDLRKVKGIGDKLLEQIRERIVID